MTATTLARYADAMRDTLSHIAERGLIAVVDTPDPDRLLRSAQALVRGGIRLLGIPATLDDVVDVAGELAEDSNLILGMSRVNSTEQVSLAMMASAQFVLSSFYDEEFARMARDRGMVVIVGAATPTEVVVASRASDLVNVFPAQALGGPDYLATLRAHFPHIPLVVSGGVNVDSAPSYLEAGALAVIVDQGLVPEDDDATSGEVIEARAMAMVEVCDVASSAEREAVIDLIQSLQKRS
ncbi:MAG: bifunctional 4-hydroxy-2-oxoglutarate aldolase/2-dehydro-3-deoxy-phosphogluconate aldolase [Pseudomonadota bacterium]